VSTFYVLPPRPVLGARFADYLSSLFPGLDWGKETWGPLAEALAGVAARPDVYFVHREDLPTEPDVGAALQDAFGAESGDDIIELLAGDKTGVKRWRLGHAG
jgi:hypothetical protein